MGKPQLKWLVINIDQIRLVLTPIIPFSASVLRKTDSSLAWPRNFSYQVQLAICIADVGVSAFRLPM